MALTHFYLNQVRCHEEYFKKKTSGTKVEWGGGLEQGE